MATRSVQLPLPGPCLITGGTNNTPMRVAALKTSTGTPPTDAPKLSRLCLLASPTVREYWAWQFVLPRDYVSGGSVRVLWESQALGGNVKLMGGGTNAVWNVDDLDLVVSGTVAHAGPAPAHTVIGRYKSLAFLLSLTGAAQQEFLWTWVGRDATHVDDTNGGDVAIVGCWFEYEDA